MFLVTNLRLRERLPFSKPCMTSSAGGATFQNRIGLSLLSDSCTVSGKSGYQTRMRRERVLRRYFAINVTLIAPRFSEPSRNRLRQSCATWWENKAVASS